jgi:predicted kinase
MLVGVPGAGKSTWIAQQGFDRDTVIISTDRHIDAEAARQGLTYSEVFKGHIKRATAIMNADLAMAIKDGDDIVWDQTNTTAKIRAAKLASVPNTYRKVAVFFPTPEAKELERRLACRPGKHIPWNILQGMISQLEAPTKDEGFDEVVVVS